MRRCSLALLAAACALVGAACGGGAKQAAARIEPTRLALFGPLPQTIPSPGNIITQAKVDLGRQLYYETRLSRSGDISCNSCHHLDAYGADTGRVSAGFQGQLGGRNSPTVYNAAGHVAQFWDGRAGTVETQALGPLVNADEMAMPNPKSVEQLLRADPSYQAAFHAAFPAEREPISYENVGRAIGAFERGLLTPSRWDRFLRGDRKALTDDEKIGFNTFVELGCSGCHTGTLVGGSVFQKAGVVHPWPDTADVGREAVTRQKADRMVFKVPSLRNIERTGPYFHNGRVVTLDSAIVQMAHVQLGRDITPVQVAQVRTWLHSLTGDIPQAYIAAPRSQPPRSD